MASPSRISTGIAGLPAGVGGRSASAIARSAGFCLLGSVLAFAVVGCGGSVAVSETPGAALVSPSVSEGVTASAPPTASPAPKTSKVVITPAPKLDLERWLFTATKLADGRVLLTGGYTLADQKKACSHFVGSACATPITATAEIYDPRSNSFAPTGSMISPRILHQAVLLRDGRVLVIGGRDDPSTAEIYDPATGQFHDLGNMHQDTSGDAGPIFTPAPSDPGIRMLESQIEFQTVTVLVDGRVLIAGGQDLIGDSSNAVTVFDPTTNTFANLPGMPMPWRDASASPLPDGRVLLTGGLDTSTYSTTTDNYETTNEALLFDPATNSFSRTGNTTIARDGGRQVALRDGLVLVVGGLLDPSNPGCGSPIQAEVYDPSTGRFSVAGGLQPSWTATPVFVPDGRVLLLGGFAAGSCTTYQHDVEAYDPDSGTVSLLASGGLPGVVDYAFALDDGSILLLVEHNGQGEDAYFLTLE